jgi:hypothetical protein
MMMMVMMMMMMMRRRRRRRRRMRMMVMMSSSSPGTPLLCDIEWCYVCGTLSFAIWPLSRPPPAPQSWRVSKSVDLSHLFVSVDETCFH